MHKESTRLAQISDINQISVVVHYVLMRRFVHGILSSSQIDVQLARYTPNIFYERLRSCTSLVYDEGDGATAVITLDPHSQLDGQPIAEIKNFYVALENLNRGLGTVLMAAILLLAQEQGYSEVFTYAQLFCQRFYEEKFGFERVGTRQVAVYHPSENRTVPHTFVAMRKALA